VLEANLQHLKSSTTYHIRVFAFNSYGYGETPASLTVQTLTEGKNHSLFSQMQTFTESSEQFGGAVA